MKYYELSLENREVYPVRGISHEVTEKGAYKIWYNKSKGKYTFVSALKLDAYKVFYLNGTYLMFFNDGFNVIEKEVYNGFLEAIIMYSHKKIEEMYEEYKLSISHLEKKIDFFESIKK
jgi:hypothetical protein